MKERKDCSDCSHESVCRIYEKKAGFPKDDTIKIFEKKFSDVPAGPRQQTIFIGLVQDLFYKHIQLALAENCSHFKK